MLSNSLTGLTLLPLLLIAFREAHGWGRPSLLRLVEATALSLGLLGVGVWLFTSTHDNSVPTRLYAPLPFLLWAAVRFGSVGTIMMLSAITALAVGGVALGRGPFDTASPVENLLHLQFFLIAIALPLLLLASLVRQQARTEAELRRSQTRYRSIVEDQTELICRFLPDGTYTFVNGAYCRYFEHTSEELVGRSFWMFIPTEHHQEARDCLDSITPEHPVATAEHEVVGPGGEIRWQQWTNRGLFDAGGRLLEFQAVGRDVTERRRVEEDRRQMESQKRVEEALREADRRKDEFLAILGHELRNPLAPVGVALEIMRRSAPSDEQTAWAWDVIARQMHQMTRLVDDLLDISRITHGKIGLLMDRVDLARVVAQGIETSRPHIDARQHSLVVSLPDTPAVVRGDALRLAQIVSNLLNNAARHTEPGGRVDLSLTTLPAGGGKSEAVLTVRDNGAGIAPALLPHVFDLFSQGKGTGDVAPEGLGIGLTMVKQLVELHGGRVDARSDHPGGGSELIVHLPLVDTLPAVSDASARPASPVAGTPLRILIVDDNVDVAKSLARLLIIWGHTVRTANDAQAALDEAATFAPHAILLDHGLPKMDGLEVARRLRARYAGRPLLLAAMTGFGQIQHRQQSTDAGFDHHFTKPIDVDALQGLLATHSQTIVGISAT